MYSLSSAITKNEQSLEQSREQEENSKPQRNDLPTQGPEIRNHAPTSSPLLAPSDFEINEKDQHTDSSANIIIATNRSNINTQSTQGKASDDDPSTNKYSLSDHRFKIFKAATNGNLSDLQFLLKKKGGIDQYFPMHCPYHGCLTHIAIKTNQPKLLRWLIENGADIWSTNNFRENALDYAAENNQSEMLEMLIKRALRENSEKKILNYSLQLAARADAPDLMSWILELGGDLDHIQPDGRTLAVCAIESGGTKALTWIHSKGVDVFQKMIIFPRYYKMRFMCAIRVAGDDFDDGPEHMMPLRLALTCKNFEAIEWLISRGALHHIESNERDAFLHRCLLYAFPRYGTLTKRLLENWQDPAVAPNGFNAMAHALRGLIEELSGDSPRPAAIDGYIEIINFIAPISDMAEKIDGKTPILLAIEHNLVSAIMPLTQATLQHPRGTQLLEEAHRSTKDIFIKDILSRALNDPASLNVEKDQHPENDSRAKLGITNFPLMAKIAEKFTILDAIKFSLGDALKGLTHRQAESAKHGIYALLLEWRLGMTDSSDLYGNFSDKFTTSLVQRLTNSAMTEIDNLIEKGERWEKENIQPIINRIFYTLYDLMKNETSLAILPDILSGLGFYRPFAYGITNAWKNAWKEHIKSTESSSLQLSPEAADRLLKNFKTNLSSELDSMSGRVLRLNETSISETSKHLYADLMARQLALLAPLWRNNS